MLAFINGENDGANWHWLVRTEDGKYAYLTGGCDYTGWDCQSSLDTFVEDTLDAALRQVGDDYRDALREQMRAA